MFSIKFKLPIILMAMTIFTCCSNFIFASDPSDGVPKPDANLFNYWNRMELVHVQEYHNLNQANQYARLMIRNGLIAEVHFGAPNVNNPGVNYYFVHVYVRH